MTVMLSPETEQRLKQKATLEGGDINRIADELISSALDWETLEMEETIEAVRRSQEAIAQGRERPLAEFIAEQRRKYGFPESWPNDVEAES